MTFTLTSIASLKMSEPSQLSSSPFSKSAHTLPVAFTRLQASILAGAVESAASDAIGNLGKTLISSITGGSGEGKANDRPQVSMVESIIQRGAFQLKTGTSNSTIDTTQYITYNKSDSSSETHVPLRALNDKKFLISKFEQSSSSEVGDELYGQEIGLNPMTSQLVAGAYTRFPPWVTIGHFFELCRWKSIDITIVPYGTIFHKTTLIISMVYGSTRSPSLEQASNQLSTTLELDGSGAPATMNIPFSTPYPWLKVQNGERNSHIRGGLSDASSDYYRYVLGRLSVKVLTKLTANSDVVSDSVQYLIYYKYNGVEYRLPNTFSNTPLLRNPTFDEAPLAVTDPRYLLVSRTQLQSGEGIADSNVLVATPMATKIGTHTSIGGIPVPTFADYASRQNVVAHLQIDKETPVGRLAAFDFVDLLSNQARAALAHFTFANITNATMKINCIVQGGPTIRGAIAVNTVPLTTAAELPYKQPDAMSMCMLDNTVVASLDRADSFEFTVPLSNVVGGNVFTNQLVEEAFAPFCLNFWLLVPYSTGSADLSPHPVSIAIRTSLHDVVFTTPALAPDSAQIHGSAPVMMPFAITHLQSMEIKDPQSIIISDQTPSLSTGVSQSSSISSEDIEVSLMNSWVPIVTKACPESSTTSGDLKGVIMPLYNSYAQIINPIPLDSANYFPRSTNMSISPGCHSQATPPSGFSEDQCVFARPHPVSVLSGFYGVANCDISLAFFLNTRSNKGTYYAQVFFNPDALYEGYNFQSPENVSHFTPGIATSAIAIIKPGKWTTITIPWTSMMGTIKTSNSTEDFKDVIHNPWVIRITTDVRSGKYTGTVQPAPQPTYDFGAFNVKTLLDQDLTRIEIYARVGEAYTLGLPLSLPSIMQSSIQQQGKYSADEKIVSVPTVFRFVTATGSVSNFTATQQEIVDNRQYYTFPSAAVAYDSDNPTTYWDSLKIPSFDVQFQGLTRDIIATLTGQTIAPTSVIVGDGTVLTVETKESVLGVPEFIPLTISEHKAGSGTADLGFDRNVYNPSGTIYQEPGTNNTFYSVLSLSGEAYKYPAYVATLPAPYNTYQMIPSGNIGLTTHTLALEASSWAPVADSNIETATVFLTGGIATGVLQGLNVLTDYPVDELKSSRLSDLPVAKTELQSKEEKNKGGGGKGFPAGLFVSPAIRAAVTLANDDDKGEDEDEESADSDDDSDFCSDEEKDEPLPTGRDPRFSPEPDIEEKEGGPSFMQRVIESLYEQVTKLRKIPKHLRESFNALWDSPKEFISNLVFKLVGYVRDALKSVSDSISLEVCDWFDGYKTFIKETVESVPIFLLVGAAVLLVTEIAATSTFLTKVLPFVLNPIISISRAACGVASTFSAGLNGWFWDGFESVRSAYNSKFNSIESVAGGELPEFLEKVETGDYPVLDESEKVSFGSKLSHWAGVLINFFSTNVIVQRIGCSYKQGLAALAIITWIEKHASCASRLFALFGKIAPTYYTYVMSIFCRNHPVEVAEISESLEVVKECLLFGPDHRFFTTRKEYFSHNLTKVKRFYNQKGHIMPTSTHDMLREILNSARVLEAAIPNPVNCSALREKTLFVIVVGAPRIGKTLFIQALKNMLSSDFDVANIRLHSDYRIEKNMYNGQALVFCSEVITTTDETAHIEFVNFLNGMVDNSPFVPESAGMNSKGDINFHPLVFLTTTNWDFRKPLSGVVSYTSTLERMLIIKAYLKSAYELNGSVNWDKVNNETKTVGHQLAFAPIVPSRGKKPRGSFPESESSNITNPHVLIGREADARSVRAFGSVSCAPIMDSSEVVDLIMRCRTSIVSEYNRLVDMMTDSGIECTSIFEKDLTSLFEGPTALSRSSLAAAMAKNILVTWLSNFPDRADEVFKFFEEDHHINYLASDEVSIFAYKKCHSEITIAAREWNHNRGGLTEFISSLSTSQFGYVLTRTRDHGVSATFTAAFAEQLEKFDSPALSHEEVIKCVVASQSFTSKYILFDRPNTFRLVLRDKTEDYFVLQKEVNGSWKTAKASSEVWNVIKGRVHSFAAIASSSSPMKLGVGPIPRRAEIWTPMTSIGCNPFSHAFWCSAGIGCSCSKPQRSVIPTFSSLIEKAADNPVASFCIGVLAYRVFKNMTSVVDGVRTIYRLGTDQDEVPPASFIYEKNAAHLSYQTVGQNPIHDGTIVEHIFVFRSRDTVAFVEALEGYLRSVPIKGSYSAVADTFLAKWAELHGVSVDDLIADFSIYTVKRGAWFEDHKPTFVSCLTTMPQVIFGVPTNGNYLRAYTAGLVRMIAAGSKEVDGHLELVEEFELQSRSGRSRPRRIRQDKRKQQPKRIPKADTHLQSAVHPLDLYSYGHNSHTRDRYDNIVSRLVDIDVRVVGSGKRESAFGIDIGMNKLLTVAHIFYPSNGLPLHRKSEEVFNPIADKCDVTITDCQNVDLSIGVDNEQVHPVSAIRSNHHVDLVVVDLGNGQASKKMANYFLPRSALEERLSFTDVLFLAPGRDPVVIPRAIVRPDVATVALKSDARFIHDGVLLMDDQGEAFEGCCGGVYVACVQGNFFVVAVHIGRTIFPDSIGLGDKCYTAGILISKESFAFMFASVPTKTVKKKPLPVMCDLDQSSGVLIPQEEPFASDPSFSNLTSFANDPFFARHHEGKEPAHQFIGLMPGSHMVTHKTSLQKSPIFDINTRTASLHAPAYQGGPEASSEQMALLGLARTTRKTGRMGHTAYKTFNSYARSVIVENPPPFPLKSFLSFTECINGGWADSDVTTAPDCMSASFVSNPEIDCMSPSYASGSIFVKGIDTSSSAGWLHPKGLKQRDFLCQRDFLKVDGSVVTLNVVDSSTDLGREALAIKKAVLAEFRSGGSIWMFFRTCLKDEALTLTQVKDWLRGVFPNFDVMPKGGKTRIITIVNWVINCCLKMSLGIAMAYIKKLGPKLRMAASYNPYSPEHESQWSVFDPVSSDYPCFMGADVSDQESHIDSQTASGLVDLIESVYEVQETVWVHTQSGPSWAAYKSQLARDKSTFETASQARVGAIISSCPSINGVAEMAYVTSIRNQSGIIITSFLSWYFGAASECYALDKALWLAKEILPGYLSRPIPPHLSDCDGLDRRGLMSGDDQVICFTQRLIELFAHANASLIHIPPEERCNFPSPLETDIHVHPSLAAGSFVAAVTKFYCGVAMIDPVTSKTPQFVFEDKVSFLGNITKTNPALTALIKKYRHNLLVRKFAELQESSTDKCLNWIRVPPSGCPDAALVVNMNTVLELTFTRGFEAFELRRSTLSTMLASLEIDAPLVTFTECLDRFCDRDYILGDEGNYFSIRR